MIDTAVDLLVVLGVATAVLGAMLIYVGRLMISTRGEDDE